MLASFNIADPETGEMTLHPDILSVLKRFDERRRRLLLFRAAFTGAATLLSGCALASFADIPVPLGTPWVWSAAALVYGVTLALFWKRAGGRLARSFSPRSAAALVESAAPHLQGVVLSAVELAAPHPSDGDSTQLRLELQTIAAQKTAGLNPPDFLPWNLLRTDVRILAASGLLMMLGVAVDGPRFGTRCLRFLLPFAAIQRPSDTEIQLEQPQPLDGIVPENEPVTVSAMVRNIKGGPVAGATLLADGSGAERFAAAMTEASPGRFVATLPISSSPVHYRITAGDASTPAHRLDPRPRPSVKAFEKSVTAPSYTGMPVKFEHSPDGLISALEGSVVDIVLRASEPIASGTLIQTINGNDEIVASAVAPGDPTTLKARLQVRGQGSYAAKLVSQSTGFTSASGVQWEIRAEPDSPPVVRLDSPENDVLLQLGSKVRFTGEAVDDFGLDSVVYEVQHNRGGWTAFPHAGPSGKQLAAAFVWDPLAHAPKTGDTFSLRLAAFDAKRQRAESRVVRISIAKAAGLPPPSLADTFHKAFSGLVAETQRQTAEALKSLTEAKAAYDSNTPAAPSPSLALLRAEQGLAAAGASAEAATKAVLGAIASTEQPARQSTLETQAKALNRLLHAGVSDAIQSVSKIRNPEASERSRDEELDLLKRALDSATRASSLARLLQEAENATAASAEAPRLAAGAMALTAEHAAEPPLQPEPSAQAQPSPATSPVVPGQISADEARQEAVRRQQVYQSASAQFQRELQSLGERSPTTAQRLNGVRNSLRDAQAKAEGAAKQALLAEGQAAAPAAMAKSNAAHHQLAQTLDQVAKALASAHPALVEAEERALKRLNEEIQQGSERLAKSVQELSVIENKKKLSSAARDEQSASRLQMEADVLRADADLEGVTRNAAPDAAKDLAAAADAVEELSRSAFPPGDLRSKVQSTASALKTLEGAAAFKETLEEAGDAARNQILRPGEKNPVDALSKKLQALPQRLKQSDLPAPLAEAAQSALAALSKKDTAGPETALNALKEAAPLLEEPSRSARASLEALAPKLSSKMERLSQQARESASRSAEQARQPDPADGRQLLDSSNSDLNKRIDRLRQDLRTEANAQDSMSEAGRTRARDADDAAAQLKASAEALKGLQNMPKSKTDAAAALARSADQQGQLASRLKQMAEHFRSLESGSAEAAAQSRPTLREMEQRTGTKAALEAREERAKTVSEAASASAETLQEKLKQLASQNAATPAPQASAVESLLKEAAEAMNAGDTTRATAAASGAVEQQKRLDRSARAVDSETIPQNSAATESGTGAGAGSGTGNGEGTGDLPSVVKTGGGEWGRLPQKVAVDLMEGKREAAPGEYRSAVDAYFKAVAEKARGKKTSP